MGLLQACEVCRLGDAMRRVWWATRKLLPIECMHVQMVCVSPLVSLARLMCVVKFRTQFSLSLSLAANAWNDFSVWLI